MQPETQTICNTCEKQEVIEVRGLIKKCLDWVHLCYTLMSQWNRTFLSMLGCVSVCPQQGLNHHKHWVVLMVHVIFVMSKTMGHVFIKFHAEVDKVGPALQAGRSPVWFLMVSLEFFIDIILPATLWPWGQLSFCQKWVPGIFPLGLRWPVRRADNLTTFSCWLSCTLGASTSWNRLGLSRPVMG
jgi:hypothetical protein